MSYIYKIINNINKKLYIGKTDKTIKSRFEQHYKDSKKIKNQERLLYKAINQYGIENFSIEQIEECPSSKSNEREKFWIEYYDSFKNGYNATLGGDGSANLDYDLIYNIYRQKKIIN